MAEDYPRSLLELERRFSTESGCRAYLWALRWPRGIDCPRCGHREFWPMSNGRQSCKGCSHQLSVMAGTVFQDSKLPLTTWFRAMWHVASQKNGISALGVQRDLGLGSYKTAWSLLHKLRRAMVRPGRDRLTGVVEVDETYWGAEESGGATGRLTYTKSLIAIAAQQDGKGIGRIRLARIPDTKRQTLHRFIVQSVEEGSTIVTRRTQCLSTDASLQARASRSGPPERGPPFAAESSKCGLPAQTLDAWNPPRRRRSRAS